MAKFQGCNRKKLNWKSQITRQDKGKFFYKKICQVESRVVKVKDIKERNQRNNNPHKVKGLK